MRKSLLIIAGLTLLSTGADAQVLRENYIVWPSSSRLHSYVSNWTKGTEITTTYNSSDNAVNWEDENFFISRVKIKPYIINKATQVYPDLAVDKRLLFWVPIGNSNVGGVHTDALPNGVFDSEVFSTWSYVTHFGDWISPFGWVPGGFADAAHKHGTAVSGVASIPNALISASWRDCLASLANRYNSDASKLGDFLTYHGVDGLGYNSEFGDGGDFIGNLSKMHGTLTAYMRNTKGNTKFENPWYTGTNDRGSIDFTSALTSSNKGIFGTNAEPRTSFFVNYEWLAYKGTTDGNLTSSGNSDRALDLYMGMNMQGGCKSANEWTNHATNPYSIGLWGAHDFNYLWSQRSKEGSSDVKKQETYQKNLEQWFSNGNRNPANTQDILVERGLAPKDDWHGMSRFMSARSSLGWKLSEEPFVSYLNLGNGRFFNWKGERQTDNEWYNLGVQDYMPTWRWWWSSKFVSGNKTDVPASGLTARFTWDDAYMGGSCLHISGSNAKEYLHLFKTQFTLSRNDVITVRYKLLGGSAKMRLALSTVGGETTEILPTNAALNVFTETQLADDEVWVEKQIKVTGALATPLANKDLAMLALRFDNATNLDLYIGEISIRKASATPTPAAPVIDDARTKVLANNASGVDGKIIFNMANSKAAGEPVYNLDVNTSVFKLYAQYEGGEEQLVGMTSSWAALYFAVPRDNNSATRIRFGVSAVSADWKSESTIAWSSYKNLTTYETSDEITIDKQVIKPEEEFTISFVDPKHADETFTIYNATGDQVYSGTGTSITTSLSELGGYDVVVGTGSNAVRYNYFVQISSKDKGAVPRVLDLSYNGSNPALLSNGVSFTVNENINVGYSGREANGSASRGIRINNQFVGAKIDDLGLVGGTTSFTVAAWLRLELPKGSSCLFSIEDRGDSWPINNWGFLWCNVAGLNGSTDAGHVFSPGAIENHTFRSSTAGGSPELRYNYDNAVVPHKAWTHVVFTIDWNSSGYLRSELYINGVKQAPSDWKYGSTEYEGTDNVPYSSCANRSILKSGMWMCFGGGRGSEPNFNDGVVDDVVVWKGVMNAEQVKTVMNGLDPNNLPEEVIAYWDLEEDADGNTHEFLAKGQKAGAKLSNFTPMATGGEGQGVNTPIVPLYEAGTPFISGTGFVVDTKPTWSTRRFATISNATGNDVEGSAQISYPRAGDYTVKLRLDNSYGSDEKEYPVFTVTEETQGIGDINADGSTNVYTIDRTLFVEFAESGDYTVSVYDMSGRLVGKTDRSIVSGQNMTVTLAQAGVYVVNIEKDGKKLRSIKVLCK